MALLLGTSVAEAQIQVQAPKQVAVGENFKIEYTITNAEVKNFRGGSVPSDGFEFIAGPYTSQSSYVNMVNGHVTQTSSITYTYTYYAQKNGTYTISPAHAKINGKDVASQSIKITVSGTAQQNHSANQRTQPSQRQQAARVNPRGSAISGNDLFITVTANKKRVHEQEPVLLTYKVFTQVELSQLEGKMPDLNGFHTQEIPLPQQKSFHLENVNGKPYRCVTWSQYVMFPQMTGKLEIPSITFKGIVVQENPNIDPFEAFFNGGSSYVEVKKDIKAPAIQIQVDPLPDKPADFSGGVGQFSVSASVDKNTVRAGDPINLCLKVSGTGNLKLIKQPEFELPKDFENYGTQEVTEGMKLVEETGKTFDSILESIETVSSEIQEASAVSEEMAASVDQVSAAIEQVTRIAEGSVTSTAEIASASEEQLASMEEVTASASSLARMAEELKEKVVAFKI